MPRVLPRDMAQAFRLHPLLGKLMGVCRTVEASKRELRWLEDEVLRLSERDSLPFVTEVSNSVLSVTDGCNGIGVTEREMGEIASSKICG